jgi:dTDP-4-amino-4,6-dideoxygalactose transaminase
LAQAKITQQQFYAALYAAGIGVNVHYIPVYRQPYYEKMGFKAGYCPQSEQYYSEVISIPMYPGLTHTQQDFVVQTLRAILVE